MQRVHGGLIAVCLAGGLLGCAGDPPATQPSAYERSEKAIKDPFGYSPNVPTPEDISGGQLNEFDRKGFNRDANDVFNP